ncbi:glycosyltransferase family 2 protein [Halobellus ordinarius]|uniref:glycosyltransferase family 2 protein n=1 Tax=Halobellus ordinarius TaxID=3075120 RepID=UPI0028803024|nr:glycosyltransferase family 2 protein [Halobellus sp. ZY16]
MGDDDTVYRYRVRLDRPHIRRRRDLRTAGSYLRGQRNTGSHPHRRRRRRRAGHRGLAAAEFDDVHVVAEADIDVAGATVQVVPDNFSCAAVRKGRALEWAHQTLTNDREFVLYLDEDSHLESFEGLPDADIVQFREQPRRTDSVLSYLADVYRMGVQIEQRAFARLSIPLFAWGGGIAVKQTVEDEVTWDRETIVEDTAFVWAAAQKLEDFSFELATATCRNEAPPSLTEITQQRRRWSAGNIEAASALPFGYQVLTRVRNYAWALSPIVTLIVVPLALLGIGVGAGGLFAAASFSLGLLTLFWYLRGVQYYGVDSIGWALPLPLAPLVIIIHSMGTVAGILNPPTSFRVKKSREHVRQHQNHRDTPTLWHPV